MATEAKEKETTETLVSFQNSSGMELQATLLKMTRFQATFEVYGPAGVLRMSEALTNFRILFQGRPMYFGRAVVSNLIPMGSVQVCEAALDESCLDLATESPVSDGERVQSGFEKFIIEWGKNYKIASEFKVAMADMQTFFLDLRLWMEQMELAVRSQPSGDRLATEREVLRKVQTPVLPAIAPVLERFEAIAATVDPELKPAYRAYMKRQIHPLVMCSPFLFRTYAKPLGYAGDYEMVNMMLGDPFEGGSMFAKLVNGIFLLTPPVTAHQARIVYLKEKLAEEARRMALLDRPLRVFNLGCGPAREIQEFMAEEELSGRSQLTLLDFNQETLDYTGKLLGELRTRHGRGTQIQMLRKSVHQILKEVGKPVSARYDLVYCAGLFDYLSDQVCKKLLGYLYDLVVPGGLMIATNVSDSNPSQGWMEYVLDWHLIYRNAAQFAALSPLGDNNPQAVKAIAAGVNIALEIRKPDDAH
jgi:extracellular factor (EF) 3-hydroxypalmitic acid methyl ester biosynthesis protein